MSLMTREDMLRELELLPAWQMRQPLPMSLKTASPAPEEMPTEPTIPAVVDSLEAEPVLSSVPEPVSQGVQALPLRLLLSEDNAFAFLITPYAAEDDMQAIETLLKNMIRAMHTSCHIDVTDMADNIFAEHAPKLIISMGAEPANALFNKSSTVEEWRSNQHENQPLYGNIPVIVTCHPAYLLENTLDKAQAWRDLCLAMKLVPRL